MKHTVLVVGKHKDTNEIILRLIKGYDHFEADLCVDISALENKFEEKQYSIALIGAGFTPEEEGEIKSRISGIDGRVHIVDHYGGGSGLLLAELEEAVR